MGSNKIKAIDVDQSESPKSPTKKPLRTKAGPKSKPETELTTSPVANDTTTPVTEATKNIRSRRYQQARSQVDKTKTYPAAQAVTLLKKISSPKHPTVVADIQVTESKLSTDVSFPHTTGKSITVAIVDDKLLAQIEAGHIDFDVLLSTPEFMPKLAKLARTLGPKGLMPNPKNGTLTPDPIKKQKELSAGKTSLKTEKSAPLLHVQFGKIDQPDKELLENLAALVKAIDPHKISKLVISSTMSPGVKIDVSAYIE